MLLDVAFLSKSLALQYFPYHGFVWSSFAVSILASFKVCSCTLFEAKLLRKKKNYLFWIRNNLAPHGVQTFWNGLVEFIVKFRMGEGRVQADSL